MRSILLAVMAFLPFNLLMGQPLSTPEALDFAQKLFEIEILSEKGKDMLIEQILENKLDRPKKPDLIDGSVTMTNDLSKSQILLFLTRAFGSDLFYRTGVNEQTMLLKEYQEKNGNAPFDQEQLEAFQQYATEKLKDFEGKIIEEAIDPEEGFEEDQKSINLDMMLIPQLRENQVIHTHRSVLGKTKNKTLSDLLEIGLISKAVYNDVQKPLQKKQIPVEVFLLGYATQRAIFYEDYEENVDKENQFIYHLNQNGLISDARLQELIKVAKPGELRSKFDLLRYCDRAMIFDLHRYSPDPGVGFRQIYEEIRAIVPNFDFTNFQASLSEASAKWGSNLVEQRACIGFEVDGVTYSNSFFYDYKPEEAPVEEKAETGLLRINNEFHRGINKLLADRNAPYRLYYANKPEPGNEPYGQEEFGLILMTEKQYEAWGTSNSDYFIFSESHDNAFNTINIQHIIEEYEKIGLFSHLSSDEITSAKICARETEIDSYQSILFCFPKTIVFFDWESANLENPYEELTVDFSEASRGAFKPQNIIDDFKNAFNTDKIEYGFEFNGKIYHRDLTAQSDWLDPQFMELIDIALKENKVDGAIYYCMDDGQAAGFIFLNEKQHAYLKAHQPALFPGR